MSIASDLRAYADTAVNTAVSQGKQTISVAQAQFSGVTDPALGFANEVVGDLREQAEKLVNVDALRTALEPYVAQLKSYGDSVTDRVDELVETLKKDPRFGKFVEQADSFSAVLLELVQERVVKPVQSFAGVAARPSQPAAKPSPKPAAKPSTATKPAATRPTTRKPAAKTTARKAPAKRAAAGTSEA
jgi:hypothetical protein